MGKRRVLIAGLILLVLAGGLGGALASMRGGDERSAGLPESRESSGASTKPARSRGSTVPIRFVLGDRYAAGRTIDVAIENVGTRPYLFQPFYQACFLRYFDSSGRRFIIPPGTHCDILGEETIKPGERKKLFTWSLDECVKDEWGCLESRPLPPGTYTIKGRFKPRAGGTPVRAETTFRIVAT
jgi:hypothetical protein